MAGTSAYGTEQMRALIEAGMGEVLGPLGLHVLIDWEAFDRIRNPPPSLWRRFLNWVK